VKKILLTATILAFISTAQAQGYVVQSPGHRPAYAIPRGDGTYVIPGQRPTYITPRATASMSFNRLDIGLYTQSRARAAPMSFRDKGPRTLRPGRRGGLASHSHDGCQSRASPSAPKRISIGASPSSPCGDYLRSCAVVGAVVLRICRATKTQRIAKQAPAVSIRKSLTRACLVGRGI
jgi:hypothetical protein